MKVKIFFFLAFFLFFLNTQYNLFELIPNAKFAYSFTEKSEGLVAGKLLNSEQYGITENGGFTGFYISEKNQKKANSLSEICRVDMEEYLNNIKSKKIEYIPYKTQIGGQAIFYSLIAKVFNFSNQINYMIFRSINSILLSLVLTFFLSWINKRYGFITALISFIFIFTNYWIFLYGKSIWWCMWIYYLPFIFFLNFFENNQTLNYKKYYFYLFTFILLKFWVTGFEFITTFLISCIVPYLFYYFKPNMKIIIEFIISNIVITFSALIINLLFQLYQFYLITGDYFSGIHHLIDAYSRRSDSGYTYPEKDFYLLSLKKIHMDILIRYLGNSVVNEDITIIKLPFIFLITFGIICSLYLYKNNIERKLIWVTLFSVISPLSWFILFQQHAHIHTHIDFFLWYVPFLLLLILIISITITALFQKKLSMKI